MATKYVRKLLFSIFIVGAEVPSLQDKFPKESITKENAEKEFSLEAIVKANPTETDSPDANPNEHPKPLRSPDGSPRVKQIGFYYGKDAGVLVGVADADGLIEVSVDGKPQIVGMDPETEKSEVAQAFVASIVKQAELGENTSYTWVLVPLDELGGGFGTLHLGGMAGISGG